MNNKSYGRFLIVWTGQLISNLGTGMTAFALGVYVYSQTNSAASFAAVMVMLFVPGILLSPLGGVLADRFDRRFLIILGDTGSAVAVIYLLSCLNAGGLSTWNIYLGVTIGSSFTALQGPAYKASLTDMLTESQFARAGGLVQLASAARHLIAPITAGFILSIGGLQTILLIDAGTFVFAVTAAMSMAPRVSKRPVTEKPHLLTDMKEGWESISRNPVVKGVIYKLAIVTFFVGYIQTLFTPMMLSLTAVKTLGTIQSISAFGMLVGSLLISILGLIKDVRHQWQLTLGLGGFCLAIMAMNTNLIVITIFLFLFFLCLPLINTSAEVLIRTGVSSEKQGRVWGITSLLSQTGYIGAYLSAGYLADRIFNPLLMDGGGLSRSIGRIIGTGAGRGSALIIILCGFGLVLTALIGEKKCYSLKLSEMI